MSDHFDEKASDIEKTSLGEKHYAQGAASHDVRVVDGSTSDPHMHRALKGRQVSMIAIAGTIGTGLFLGSGKAIANGGPVGAVIGYTIVGCLVGMMMYCLGEVCFHFLFVEASVLIMVADDVLRSFRWRFH